MPTKKSSKQSPKVKKLDFARRDKVAVCIMVVFVIFGLVTVREFQQSYEADQDEKRLEAVDKKMQVVQDAIIAEIGKPAYHKHSKSCSFPNLEAGRGQLACSTSFSLSYGINHIDQGVNFAKSIEGAVNRSGITQVSIDNNSKIIQSNTMWLDLYPQDISGVRCSMGARADRSEFLPPSFDSSLKLDTPLTFIFSFACSKPTPKAFYRLDH